MEVSLCSAQDFHMLTITDISAANITFAAPGLEHLSREQLFERTGQPFTVLLGKNVSWRDESGDHRMLDAPLAPGQPQILMKAVGWPGWTENGQENIRIIDWGQAFYQGQEPERLAQPTRLQVPEDIITGEFDYRVDLWRAGCVVSSPDGFSNFTDFADLSHALWNVPRGAARRS